MLPPNAHRQSDVHSMSRAMGGECWTIPDRLAMHHTIDNVMGGKRHPHVMPSTPVAFVYGVVMNFEEDASTGKPSQSQMVFTQAGNTHFPIPESYWVNNSTPEPPVSSTSGVTI
jgi:hypothetical protein